MAIVQEKVLFSVSVYLLGLDCTLWHVIKIPPSLTFILRELRPLDPRVKALLEPLFPSLLIVCSWQRGAAAIGEYFQALIFHSSG